MKEKNGFILEAKNIKKTFITGDSKVEALKEFHFALKKVRCLLLWEEAAQERVRF